MTAERKKPDVDLVDATDKQVAGIFVLILDLICIAVAIFIEKRPTLDRRSVLLLAFLGLFLLAMTIFAFIRGYFLPKKKQKPLSGFVLAQTGILKHDATRSENVYSGEIKTVYRLGLEMIAAQKARNTGDPVVWAEVSKSVYQHAVEKKVIWIHYSMADPFVFLIEGEF